MKHASILLLTIGLCGLSFAACAEGDSTTFGNEPSGGNGQGGEGNSGTGGTGGSGGKPSASSSSSSSSSSSGISSGGTCSASCSADADCDSNCPKPNVGINCCNAPTKTCYVSASATCPSQGAGSSGGMYP